MSTSKAFPAAPDEPVLEVDDIQGNLLAGFNKDHVMLVFLRIDDAARAKVWLRDRICPVVASAAEVLEFNRLFKRAGKRRGFEGTVKATWINLAISAHGLSSLVPNDVAAFVDVAFQAGLAARSPELNDPTEPTAEGCAVNWHVGGAGHEADIVLVVASDDPYDLYASVQHVEDSIYSYRPGGTPTPSGVSVVFKQRGETQLGALAGHEHFGWLDGVSQPGLRGRLSAREDDLLTPRRNTADVDQGKPGQDVLWPGEFVFGYPGQDPAAADIATKGPDSLNPNGTPLAPEWARNGSYFVFRRLRQDVHAFHVFLQQQAEAHGTTPQAVGSRLVGRWPSGAPVLRSPLVDDAALGADPDANNHFEFQSPSTASSGTGVQANDTGFAASPGDVPGLLCPFSSHIRKSYPRDDVPAPGQPDPYAAADPAARRLTEVDTQTHRLLRRGIPYGPSSTSHPDAPAADADDRGLLFMAYMTSIVDQFEFVTRSWVNDVDFKEPGVGLDPILGLAASGVPRASRTVMPGAPAAEDVALPEPWVVPTGGGYFFAPSISALHGVLTA